MPVELGRAGEPSRCFSSSTDFLSSPLVDFHGFLILPSFVILSSRFFLEQEASSGLWIWSGCDRAPIRMLNTHWPLSSGPSKNKLWRPTCSGTVFFDLQLDDRKAVIHAWFIHSPARPQAPHLSTANSSHTAKEWMGHQFCLLKRNRAFLTGVKGQWL